MRVAGHALFREGRPVAQEDCAECRTVNAHLVHQYLSGKGGIVMMVQWSNRGHAACECGWIGVHRTAGRKRQDDHREHKTEVALALMGQETSG